MITNGQFALSHDPNVVFVMDDLLRTFWYEDGHNSLGKMSSHNKKITTTFIHLSGKSGA